MDKCFPRLRVFNRTKNSYNPAEDGNTDTILNNVDKNVQIGRYARYEETPIITTIKYKEPVKQQQKQQQVNGLQIPTTTTIIKSTTTTTSPLHPDNKSNGTISFNKKFISNKSNSHNNNQNDNNDNDNNNHNNNNQNIIYSNKVTHSKYPQYKPVKERRPTALPTEIPHIENNDVANEDIVATVANTRNLYDNDAVDDKVEFFVDTTKDANESFCSPTTTTQRRLSHELVKINSYNENSKQGIPTFTITSAAAAAAAVQNKISNNSNNSNSSNSRRKSQQQKRQQQQQQQMLKVNIPTPPPLPPQPLTTVASYTSMSSLKSNKTKRKSVDSHTYNDTDTPTSDNRSFSITEMLIEDKEKRRNSNRYNESDVVEQQNEDNSTILKETKSRRVDVGIIFTRRNLPIKKDVSIQYIKKDEETRNLIRTAIENNDFLNNYMDKERKELVINAMSPATYEKDLFIIKENDEGSEIYVSETGHFDVIKNGKVIGNFGPATVFGELAILYNAKRFASIKVTTTARVWKIDRETFRIIMVLSGSKESEENLNFLRSAPFLNDLKDDVLSKVVDLLQRKFYETSTCIVREGEIGNEFFIIRGGTVTIKKINAAGEEVVVDQRKRGDYFGEQALLNADTRQASVYADAPGTEVLKLDREAFISYLGTIPQLREKPEARNSNENKKKYSNQTSEFDNEYAHIQLTELKKIATLGAGAFGRVDLVTYGEKTFALKIIKKIDIVKQDQIEHVYSEKHVMMKCRASPFIIELYKTFRNEKFVYFLMEACMGGDVWTIMSKRRFFDEKTAKFLAACVVEAFDFLHSHNFIYRDLKPENLMLTTDGYCKLVDFGFAKHIPINQKTNTFAGTPEYVAPEIILDRGHDRSVDYWALGILIFELLVGKTPFRGTNQIKIYQQILGGIDVIQMPSKIPKPAQGLIKHLCKQLPAERLGYQRKGILDIKRHSWFDSIDWMKLKTKQLPSPIKRPIRNSTDLKYFVPAGVDNDHDPPDETSGWDENF